MVRCDYVVNEGGGQVLDVGGRGVYGVCVAEKGVFRFTLTTTGAPATRRFRGSATTR